MVSKRIEIEIDVAFKEERERRHDSQTGEESILFTFSNFPFNVKNFNSSTMESDVSGIGVFLYRPEMISKGTTAYLKYFEHPGRYNILNIYKESRQRTSNLACKFHYTKNLMNLKFIVDFERRNFQMVIGTRVCINYNFTESQLPQSRINFSMTAASANERILLFLNAIKVSKKVGPNDEEGIFTSSSVFLENIHKRMPEYSSNNSIVNLFENIVP